jgi:hypothetical protein
MPTCNRYSLGVPGYDTRAQTQNPGVAVHLKFLLVGHPPNRLRYINCFSHSALSISQPFHQSTLTLSHHAISQVEYGPTIILFYLFLSIYDPFSRRSLLTNMQLFFKLRGSLFWPSIGHVYFVPRYIAYLVVAKKARIGSLLVARQSLRSSVLRYRVHIKVEDDADLNHPPIYYFEPTWSIVRIVCS